MTQDQIENGCWRYRAALEIIADPSTACMSWSETVHCLRAHARNALKG